MLVILQKLPFHASVLIPFIKLRNILTHEQQLFTRMCHHKAVGCTQVFKFIRNLARHFADHGRFAVHNLIMGKYQHEFFTVGVDHTEGQLTMVLASEIRIQMHIARKIIHPAHIPFQIKTKSVLFNRLCYLRPCSRFFCDHDNAVLLLMDHTVQMLQKFDCFQIFLSTVNIRDPFAFVLAVIQIEHRCHSVHTDSVRMEYIDPEQCIGDQIVLHFRSAIIVNKSSPMRMTSLSPVSMLIQACSVKGCQSLFVLREMRRNPV